MRDFSVNQVDDLLVYGAVALDILDNEEHLAGHIAGSLNISRGKLEMLVDKGVSDLNATVLCYSNAVNRGALLAAILKSLGYVNAKYIDGGLIAYCALNTEAG